MNPQIEGYLIQLTSITQDLPGLGAHLTDAQFNWRPAPAQWSIGQCIEHLSLTTERYLPVLNKAVADARAAGTLAPGPFALGLIERWFMSSMEPPARRRFKAPASFQASQALNPHNTLARWQRLHEEFAGAIRAADGVDLRRVRVRSQFAPVSFTLNGTFAILLAHSRRHIWQARQVRANPAFPTV